MLAYDFDIKYVSTESFAYADFVSRLIIHHEKEDEDIVIATVGSLERVENNDAPAPLSKVNLKRREASEYSKALGKEGEKAIVKDKNEPRNSNVVCADEIRFSVSDDGSIAKVRSDDTAASCYAIDSAKTLPISFDDMKNATLKDESLQVVIDCIIKGWPQQKKRTKAIAQQFWHARDSLSIISDCIFFGDRIVIPKPLREKILQVLHDGHPGITRMTLLARSKVYWPNIDSDIENFVKTCNNCAIYADKPIKCTLEPWPKPPGPWSRLHIDYAGPVNGFMYLIVVDAFSNWVEVLKTTSTTAAKTAELLDEIFARQGFCDIIVTDNGTQLASEELKIFCKGYGIEHFFTAPYQPQSNGQAERFVRTFKTSILKLEGNGNTDQKLRKFLRTYRYTPSYSLDKKSPFEVMTGRIMKSTLDLLKPPKAHNGQRDEKMQQQFNSHHGARFREFELGEKVFFQLHSGSKWKWTPGTVVSRKGKVNYSVLGETPSGEREVHCHTNQMKLRHTFIDNDDNNPLLIDFEIKIGAPKIVDAEIQPAPAADQQEEEPNVADIDREVQSDAENSVFEDAHEFDDSEPDEINQQPTPRRTTRTTAGKLDMSLNHNRFNFY